MHWRLPLHLNIRQKVIVGLTVILAVMCAIGGLSYHYLLEVERKQHFVEAADDLSNIILEVRRYEKNFLLYASNDDLKENRRYIQMGKDLLRKITPEVEKLKGAPLLHQLGTELEAYSSLIEWMIEHGGADDSPGRRQLIEDELRDRGKLLVDLSQQLVIFERQNILDIIRSLKAQLVSSLGLFLILGAFLIPIVAKKIIKPLRVIEKTTLRIAQGDFTPIPVMNTRDETQRVVEAFNRMVSELEKRQEQLLQAKKLSSLGTLTSGIAHQLNNPLNNISTSSQILLEELGQADETLLRSMLTNIEQEVRRARNIVRGLLEFSRVKEFSLAPTPLVQVVERSVSLLSSHIPPGIEIVREIPEDLILNLDAQRMQQVFLNLVENAVQAVKSPPGEVRIRAKADPERKEVLITVEDTGEGIPEQNLGRVFDPFFTTREVGLGTGLGLSNVYGIIQKHQGAISVESKEGEGARFIIRFPLELAC